MMELIWQQLENTDPHTAGRQLLSRLYTQATGQPLPPIAITPQGKPYFPSGDWHFSISHTKCHVFCCLSRKNVGIDAVMCHYRPASSQQRESQYSAELLNRTTILKLEAEEMTGKRSAPKE